MTPKPIVIRVTRAGTARVLNGETNMTFVVDGAFWREADSRVGLVAGWVLAVRDYRFPRPGVLLDGVPISGNLFQVWSMSPGDYEPVLCVGEYYDPPNHAEEWAKSVT